MIQGGCWIRMRGQVYIRLKLLGPWFLHAVLVNKKQVGTYWYYVFEISFVNLSKLIVLFLFLIESLIGETYVERIIDKLQAALSKAKDLSEAGNTEPSVSFICDVASSFFSSVKGCLLMPSSEDLLLTIFQLCAQRQDATHLTGDLKKELFLTMSGFVLLFFSVILLTS